MAVNLGLRARVTATFGLGALLLSVAMAGLTYVTARHFLIGDRQASARHTAFIDASYVRDGLQVPGASASRLLDSIDAPAGSHSLLFMHGQWYATSIALGQDSLPPALRSMVLHGTPAEQQVLLGGSSVMVVGIPLPSVGASYFETFSFTDLARTTKILWIALGAAAAAVAIFGAVVGRWASGRLLRPLRAVTSAAASIAGGRMETRLSAGSDVDLAPLASSFNRMTDALQSRMERDTRFTSDVSHELRSPLTTLRTALGVLEARREELAPRTRQALDLLSAEVRRFQRMVDELLEISRVDTGAVDLSLDEVRADDFLQHAAESCGVGDVPVEVALPAKDARLSIDKRRMERVIANLVENANQYAGGVTRLAVEGDDGVVRLFVADRGPGIAPEERDAVFERFYRGRAAGRPGAAEGTGLGLALVAEHVQLHGGRVWIEAGSDGENRFVVELPLAPPESNL